MSKKYLSGQYAHFWYSKIMEDMAIEDAKSNSVPYHKAFVMIDGKEAQYSILNPTSECPTNHGDEVYLGFGKVHLILTY